ncbi:MAG: histidine kinase dimerization/phospho-acceptor domain-containing protein [Chryseolinea sp.]
MKYFVDPILPTHHEAERQRIIIFRKYLALIFALYVFGLVLELTFDFKSFTWFSFVSILVVDLFFMGLSLTNVPHRYLLTLYFFFIILSNATQFLPHPQAFHVSVFWIGISPLYVAVLANPRATLIWTIIFIVTLIAHGLYNSNNVGVYQITLYPDRLLVAGILFMLTTPTLAVFFSFTQNKIREKLNFQNTELLDLTKEIEDRNQQLKNYNEHLEDRVYERTEQLEHQNKQLAEYAFINSHLLRAPLASILGITNLLSKTKLTDEQKEYLEHLNSASIQLDVVIGKINKALDS